MVQTVDSVFTATEKAAFRQVAQNTQISWHKQSIVGNTTFTIGVSTIGGNDLIGINVGAIGSPSNYRYFDESSYVMSLGWERGYNMPTGGLTMAMGEAHLDNTSGRFLPSYMGGNSELFTAILPSRPAIISAGFNYNGISNTIPQFAGIISEQPLVSVRDRQMSLQLNDYAYYFQSKKLDTAVVFTSEFTDTVMETLASQLGMSTAQYDFDPGINLIPYGAFDVGISFAEAFGELAEAENGHVYFDETGKLIFENRQHWASAPWTNVQRVITTSMVIDAQAPDQTHLINVVEINSDIYEKQPEQIIYRQNPFDTVELASGSSTDIFLNFDDPVLSMTTPSSTSTTSYFQVNTVSDGTGTDISSSITVTKVVQFAQSAKLTFTNSSTSNGYMTVLIVTGRVAHSTASIYTRGRANSSITAYQEQGITISNRFIQNQSWADSYAQMLLDDFSTPEKLQKITIRAIPELQLGDLISWQGHYWRVFDIKAMLDPSVGFTQDLLLLQRTVTTYFRIGYSTIGGSDSISP